MNWKQVNKKTVKCLITAFSFQTYLHTRRSKQALVPQKQDKAKSKP